MRKICTSGDVMLIWVSLAVMVLFAAEVKPAAGALPMKACTMLTLNDVQSVLGSGYTQEDMLENEITSVCGYKKGDGNGVVVYLQQDVMDLKMEQAGIRQQGKSVAVTSVGGLGEGAFYFVDDKQNFQLIFGKGGRKVRLSVLTGGKPNIEAALKLAKIAYSRLG